MNLRIDSAMLSFIPFDSKVHGLHEDFESGYEYDTYVYNDKTWIVTNELENTYAEYQNYCWEQEYLRVQDSMEQLCTPYVKLTQEMLGTEQNAINLVPGSVFYLNDPCVQEAGLSQSVEIRVTNNGLEAYYGKQRLASSTYASKVRKEHDTEKEHNVQQEFADGTRNLEFHQKMNGASGYSYCCSIRALLDSLDKIVRFANGQLDVSELGQWDEQRFMLFLEYTGTELDYTKEFSINGQKMAFHNICMDDNRKQGDYAKLTYVGDSRDISEMELLDTVVEDTLKGNGTGFVYGVKEEPEFSDEYREKVSILQLMREQWNNYIKNPENVAKELLAEQAEHDWSEFFKKREEEYAERKDEENARICRMLGEYFAEEKIIWGRG